MKNIGRKIFLLISVGIIFWAVSIFSYNKNINKPASDKGDDVAFVIDSGDSVDKIAQNLAKEDLIISEKYFKKYLKKENLDSRLQAGEYILNPKLSIKEVADFISSGKVRDREKDIKIIEGWTINDIGHYLETEGMFQAEELNELVGFPKVDYRYEKDMPKPYDYSADFSFLADKPDYVGLEGYIFPDTYRIFKDADLDTIVRKSLANFDKKLTSEMREEIEKQGKTIYEIVTMASIIEKEVISKEDMKTVSGIFWNRIKNGQPLESCATLAYILGVNKPQYTLEDTKIDSPYNSYQNQGLPPGPIANPGIQAIEAAIYPEDTNYNYFLSNPVDKSTIFSVTYNEHLINKNKYLK